MTIRTLIADDHDVLRAGLRAIFSPTEFNVVAEATNGQQALQLALEHRPDIAILDVRMPAGDGLSCLARLKLEVPQIRVLMFSSYDNPTFMARAVALGAAGYLLKNIPSAEFLRAMRRVAQGEQVWQPGEIENIQNSFVKPHPITTNEEVTLTKRECEVLNQMAFGLSNREISQALGIRYETVREHVQHILHKLGVADRTQAAVWAVRQQII